MHTSVKHFAIATLVGAVLLAGLGVLHLAQRRRRLTVEERIDRYADLIWKHAQLNALPPELVRAVIRAESGGRPDAVSPKNARGLMQITPITQREVHRHVDWPEEDLFDPEYNIRVGTTYLRQMLDRFDGDMHLALAAYHMGPTRLQKIRDAHPGLPGPQLVAQYGLRSTVSYCRQILGRRSMRLPVTTQP